MKLLLFIITIIFPSISFSQNINLISNPSFEYKYISPNNKDSTWLLNDTDINNTNKCWFKAGAFWGGIGRNSFDSVFYKQYSYSRTGFEYLSLLNTGPRYILSQKIFLTSDTIKIRSYAQTKLIQPLIAGKTYIYSMYLGGIKWDTNNNYYNGGYNYNTANLGVYFSKSKVNYYDSQDLIFLKPQINFVGYQFPSIDSFRYIKLTQTFTSSGDEEYLVIGNFDSIQNYVFNNLTSYDFAKDTVRAWNLYLIDDVSLVADSILPIFNLPNFSLGNDTFICDNQPILITAPLYYQHYYWQNGDTNQQQIITKPGIYWCNAESGCATYSDTIIVFSQNYPPNNFLPNNLTICSADSTLIKAPPNYKYLWNTLDTTQSITVSSQNIFWCQITNSCGSAIDSIQIVKEPCDIKIPNAFTPNNDGTNDVVKLIGNQENFISFAIYNRYGERVFYSKSFEQPWYGIQNGKYCDNGTYYFVLLYKSNKNETKLKNGSIELIR
jgi:gliding motility-associated-like protein